MEDNSGFDDIIEYCTDSDLESNSNIPKPKVISMFQCENCDYTNSNYDNVIEHYKVAHNNITENVTANNNCTNNDDSSMLEHEEVLVCSICFSMYKNLEELKNHMIEDHDLKSIEDDANDRIIAYDKIKLTVMPFRQLQIVLKKDMIYKCSIKGCFYKFDSKEKQKTHVRCHITTSLENIKEFKCFDCGHEVLEWRNCSDHMWNEHEIDVGLLSCPICTYKALSTVKIWRHMKIHKKWKTVIFKSFKKTLKKRVITKAIKFPVKSIRPKYYSNKICQICNRKFKNTKILSKHIKSVHNKIKPFSCNVCYKKFTRKAALVIHMMQHNDERPLQCEYCFYRTRDPSALKKHKFRHTDSKKIPYKCNLCKYKAIQSSALKKHLKHYHPEEFKKISCDQCSFSSVNRLKLKQHKDDHTRGLIPILKA